MELVQAHAQVAGIAGRLHGFLLHAKGVGRRAFEQAHSSSTDVSMRRRYGYRADCDIVRQRMFIPAGMLHYGVCILQAARTDASHGTSPEIGRGSGGARILR